MMRAITVRQPWAWAIVHGGKDVENRTRNLAGSYRGPVAIHAGLAKPEKHNLASVAHRAAHGTEVPTELVFGAIVGVVDLVDVHRCSALNSGEILCCSSPWAEQPYDERHGGRRMPGPWHLEVANPRPLATPIPAKGRLGLWTPDADVVAQLEEAIR